MDLTRWGIRGIRRISDKTKNLYELVGDLLDGEFDPLLDGSLEQDATKFETRADVESIVARLLVRPDNRAEIGQIFSSLVPFFEAGFHLYRNDGSSSVGTSWCLKGLFLCGRNFTLGKSPALPFIPPVVAPSAVVSGRGEAVLRAFELDRLPQFSESTAFLFGIDGQSLFLLLCRLPAPWLEDHILRTRGALDAVLR